MPLFALLILTPLVSSITIADTTFPAEVGKRYIWDYTYPPTSEGNKLSFTANSITQGIHDTHESLIVYATLSQYIPSTETWADIVTNVFYLAANETQDYLQFNINWPMAISTLVIPTPINLSLAAEAMHDAFFTPYDYSIDGNTIKFNTTNLMYEYTFNAGGFMTVAARTLDGELTDKIVLESSGIPPAIPFGICFLIPTASSIAVMVILVKKRQLRTEQTLKNN